MRDIICVASGRSILQYNIRDLHTRGTIVACNGSALYMRTDIAVTMDRLIAENCYPIWRTQGIPEIWIRKVVIRNFVPGPDVHPFLNSEHDHSMSLEPGTLNGTNSGMCAFNLAVQKRPPRIFLLGYDMQRRDNNGPNYWHPGHDWSPRGGSKDGWLADWAEHFNPAAEVAKKLGIEVYSVNHQTRITAFPVIRFNEFLEMTNAA